MNLFNLIVLAVLVLIATRFVFSKSRDGWELYLKPLYIAFIAFLAIGLIYNISGQQIPLLFRNIILLITDVLWGGGTFFYIKSKGYGIFWSLLGFLFPILFIPFIFIVDKRDANLDIKR